MEKNNGRTQNDKKDKLVYGITLAIIFFGILSLGLIGFITNVFG